MIQKLQRLLSENPTARSFSVGQIVTFLGDTSGSAPVALFSAASILNSEVVDFAPGRVCGGLGIAMATRSKGHRIPRPILRRRIPRNALSLLIHAVTAALKACDCVIHQRWDWVFHPAMQATLGVIIFLLALASMAPIIGGGVQHAASTFIMAVGLVERDGLMVVIGALAGLAALAMAALSLSSGRRLWAKIKDWLLRCARSMHLATLARLLDKCHDGLGDLLRLRWGTLFLSLFETVGDRDVSEPGKRAVAGRLKIRARRSHFAAARAFR